MGGWEDQTSENNAYFGLINLMDPFKGTWEDGRTRPASTMPTLDLINLMDPFKGVDWRV